MKPNGEWWGQDVLPRIRWKVLVQPGNMAPSGYGIAWCRYETGEAVCMPMPLNLIAGAILGTYRWIRGGFFVHHWSPRYSEAIEYGESRGAARAWDDGYDEGQMAHLYRFAAARKNPYRKRRA